MSGRAGGPIPWQGGVELDPGPRGSAIEKLAGARLDWAAFSDQAAGVLGRSIGFDGWCFGQTDPASLLPAGAATSNSPATGSQQRFWQIEYQLPDITSFASVAGGGQAVRALSSSTSGDLARSPRWDEIMRPAGAGDELRAALKIDGYCWGSASFYRVSSARRYTGDDVRHLTQVLDALAAGARGTWAAKNPRPGARLNEGPGTIIVTAAGTPVTATAQAQRWLARLDPDPQRRRSQAIMYAISALLAAPAGAGSAAPPASLRTRAADGHWLDIHGAPLEKAMAGCDIAITIQGAAPSRVSPLLMSAHALSARERQIASLILDGRTPAEIAQALYITRYTVKDHLKAIYHKTATHSRLELTKCLTGQL